MSERRGARLIVRLVALTALAAVSAIALQWAMVERLSPVIGMLLARVPPGMGAPEGAGSASPAGSTSAASTAPAAGSASAATSTSASAAASGARSTTAPRIETVRALGAAPAGASGGASAGAQKGAMPRVTRAEIEDAIEHKLDGASAKLVRDGDGAPIGLSIQRPGRLARLGVATGDVLYAANGVRIRTPDEGLAALSQLEKATRVVVTFRRGEGTYAIAVDVAP